jgi:biopolymer transport protein ExbD
MSRSKKRKDRMLIIEITPMIDVVFLLIIFFMTTAQFARMTRAEVDLPREKGEQEQEPEEAGLVVNLTADGGIIVAGSTLTIDGLDDLVADVVARDAEEGGGPTKLLIRADRNADSTALNQLVTRLQAHGIGAARLATEVPR